MGFPFNFLILGNRKILSFPPKQQQQQVFVIRPLSTDMDIQVYNNMLVKVQHNPKYMPDYFPSSAGNDTTTTTTSATGMITS